MRTALGYAYCLVWSIEECPSQSRTATSDRVIPQVPSQEVARAGVAQVVESHASGDARALAVARDG